MRGVAILQQLADRRRPHGDGESQAWFTADEIVRVINDAWDGAATSAATVGEFWPLIATRLDARGLADRPSVIAALSTIGIETSSFRPIHEIPGPHGYPSHYEGGDRYHGRGFIQLTHRSNYRTYGARLGVPLESEPDLALDPSVAAGVLVEYFLDRGIPACARRGDWAGVRTRVLGGLGHTYDRFLRMVRGFEAIPLSHDATAHPGLRRGQVIERASSGYCTDQGTHLGGLAADIFAPEGTPIFAPSDGQSEPGLYPRGGYAATIEGEDGLSYYMAHGSVPFKAGHIRQGEQIGRVGSTGTGPGGFASSGGTMPHLHFAIADDGNVNRGIFGGGGNVFIDSWRWGR